MDQELDEQRIELPTDVVRALQLGRRAEAIALLRDATSLGPIAARRQIDQFIEHRTDREAEAEPVSSAAPDSTFQRLLLIAIIFILGLLLVFL